MVDNYSRSLLKVSIAQICQGLGWHAMQSTPCDIMVDVLQRYIEKVGRVSSQYATQFGRTHVNLDDLALCFQDIGVNLYEMENYIRDVEPIPFFHDIPKYPIPKKNNLQHPPPGSRHCRERLASIPEYMPPLVGVKEDFTPIHDRRDSVFSNMDTDSPELLSPTSQDGLEKRGEKRSPDYIDHSIKRFRLDSEGNLQEVFIGASEDSNKRRIGKLPEAVTPPRRTSVLMGDRGKSAVSQALSLVGSGGSTAKPKSPKLQKYGTQETKAPKMKMPASNSSSKAAGKSQSKSPKHHLFSPNAPSKYMVKNKASTNVGVLPQPMNQAVEFKPAKGSRSPGNGGTISTLLSAAMQIQDDENKTTVAPVKRKDSAMSIYDFDDDIEGKGKENLKTKDSANDGGKSPVTSGESKVDPNSPRIFDEYEIIRTTCPVDDAEKDVKKKDKGKVRKKKERMKQKDKRKKLKAFENDLFLPDEDKTIKMKQEPVSRLKPGVVSNVSVNTKKPKPSKLDMAKMVKVKEETSPPVSATKIVIKPFGNKEKVPKTTAKSPLTLKKTKKIEKYKKKKFKKDRYTVELGFCSEPGVKPPSKLGSPISKAKEKPLKKLNIIKTSSSNPFQIKISSPKVESPENDEVKPKKKKVKEEKKIPKEETSKKTSAGKEKEQKVLKSEPSTAVPKITLKMGGKTEGKFVIKTIHPSSPANQKEISPPPASPPPPQLSPQLPVPKISIPVLPAKKSSQSKSTTPKTPKTPKATTKKTPKAKDTSAEPPLSPPSKPKQKSSTPAAKAASASKSAKSSGTDTATSPKGSATKSKKGVDSSLPGNKKSGAGRSVTSPKGTSAGNTGGNAKSAGASTGKSSTTSNKTAAATTKGGGSTTSKPSKTSGTSTGKAGGTTSGKGGGKSSSKSSDTPKADTKEVSSKKTEKPSKKEKAPPPSPPPVVDDGPMTIVTETLGTFVSDTGEKIWICPACKRPDDGSPMVGCDECDDWYHWPCVGISCEPSEDEWFCDRCLAIRNNKVKKRGRKKKL